MKHLINHCYYIVRIGRTLGTPEFFNPVSIFILFIQKIIETPLLSQHQDKI